MKKFKIGVQLYSIRDNIAKNMDETLKKVKEMGYDYVEFAGYYDHSAEEIKEMLDKYDLKCISVHQVHTVFLENGEKHAEFLKTIGVKYCVIPWVDVKNFETAEAFDKFIEEIKFASALLKKYDIQLGYHNHDFEFGMRDGQYHLDRLYNTLSADILTTEIDTCWVHYAGQNPAEYLKKYKGRANIVHLKDFDCLNLAAGPVYALVDEKGNVNDGDDKADSGFEFRPVGYGRQDVNAILEASEYVGAEYVIVEQDQHYGADPMENIKKSREYLKSIGQ